MARCASDKLLEHRGEMGLRLEAERQCDLHDRHGVALQQFFRALHSAPQKEFVGTQACRLAELGCEVHPAQPRNRSEIHEPYLAGQVSVDIFGDPFETPLLQPSDMPTRRRWLTSPLDASHIRLQAGLSDRDRKPERLDAILVMSLLGSLQGRRQRLDHTVIRAFGDRTVQELVDSGNVNPREPINGRWFRDRSGDRVGTHRHLQ
jgi:hypothetical protein